MENKLNIFEHKDFGKLEVLIIDGKPYFPATECAKVLGYSNSKDAIIRHCRWVVKRDLPHPQSPSKTLAVNFIPEGDLYRLIIRSKLPSAEQFEKWVFDEVLPQIRKTGGYIPVEQGDSDLEIMCKAFEIQQRTIEEKESLISELLPKAKLADAITRSSDSINLSDFSKILCQNGIDIGPITFSQYLREHGYLRKQRNRWNEPRSRWQRAGYFEREEQPMGESIRKVTVITGKGQQYFMDLFLNQKEQF